MISAKDAHELWVRSTADYLLNDGLRIHTLISETAIAGKEPKIQASMRPETADELASLGYKVTFIEGNLYEVEF